MIAIKNLTKTVVDKKFLTSVAKIVLKGENEETKKDLPAGRQGISVVLVNGGKIKELNSKYRKIDKSTDVLSFSGDKDFLGEIVICPTEVRINTKETKRSLKKELAFVFIHGILHLLGYDHEGGKKEAETMREKTEYYLLKI